MARLDTGWHSHPKILGLGLAGMGLHAWSISYCDSALTDGFIPQGAWPALPGVSAAVRALVTGGLWLPCEGGYRLHDYAHYNRSKDETKALRAAAQVRKERWLERHTERVPNGVPNATQNAERTAHERHIPVPVPLKTSSSLSHPSRASAHEETLPPEVLEHLSRPSIGRKFDRMTRQTDGDDSSRNGVTT
jgi:hypothetical protein